MILLNQTKLVATNDFKSRPVLQTCKKACETCIALATGVSGELER